MPRWISRKSLMLSLEISVTGNSPWFILFSRYWRWLRVVVRVEVVVMRRKEMDNM